MKLLRVMMLGMLIVPARVCWGWFSTPKAAPNGWYWMYDNNEPGPPFASPVISPINEVEFEDITVTGTKIDPSNDIPFVYVMPDSFWYYGVWYVPGGRSNRLRTKLVNQVNIQESGIGQMRQAAGWRQESILFAWKRRSLALSARLFF